MQITLADVTNQPLYSLDADLRLFHFTYNAPPGREQAGGNAVPNYNDSSRCGFTPVPISSTDTAAMRLYSETYTYDEVGNMLRMTHTISRTNTWTRIFVIDTASNKTLSTSIGSNNPVLESYTYDARGNIVYGFNHINSLIYNEENRMEISYGISAVITTYYQYDSSGQRVRKTTMNSSDGSYTMRKYIGQWELYGEVDGTGTITQERETLSIMDDAARVALIDTGTIGDTTQLLRYQFTNHLGTATLELDYAASIISYEEYYAFGSTSFQSGRSSTEVSLKRYRYVGKERDEETGFYYIGARYYVSWIARWIAVDPLESKYAPQSPYVYCSDNPISRIDETGMGDKDNGIQVYGQAEVTSTTLIDKGGTHGNSMTNIDYRGVTLVPEYDNNEKLVGYDVFDKSNEALQHPVLQFEPSFLGDFKANYDNYIVAARLYYMNGEPSQGMKKMSAGLATQNLPMVGNGLKQEWKESLRDPVFVTGFIVGTANAGVGMIEEPSARNFSNGNTEDVNVQNRNLAINETKPIVAADETSSALKNVTSLVKQIQEEGGIITFHDLKPNQELNISIEMGKYKVDVRIETHELPAKYGGTKGVQVRHMNVDLYEYGVKLNNYFPNNGHIILKQ